MRGSHSSSSRIAAGTADGGRADHPYRDARRPASRGVHHAHREPAAFCVGAREGDLHRGGQLRSVLEPEKGIFIAESGKVIERAVEAGLEPVSFLLGERWLEQLSPLLDKVADAHPELEIPVFVGLWGRWTCWSSSRASPSRVEPLRRFVDRRLPTRALFSTGSSSAPAVARCACACSRALSIIPMSVRSFAPPPRSMSTASW